MWFKKKETLKRKEHMWSKWELHTTKRLERVISEISQVQSNRNVLVSEWEVDTLRKTCLICGFIEEQSMGTCSYIHKYIPECI